MQIETLLLVAVAVLLVEFHRRLRIVEAGVRKLLELQGVGAGPSEPSAEVRELASSGKKIEAIRLYREQSGAALKQAVQVVGQLERDAAAARAA